MGGSCASGAPATLLAEEASRREIENLMMTYAACRTQGDLDEVAELFTHGAFIVDKVPTPFRGREVIGGDEASP